LRYSLEKAFCPFILLYLERDYTYMSDLSSYIIPINNIYVFIQRHRIRIPINNIYVLVPACEFE